MNRDKTIMLYNMLGRGPPPGSPRATYHCKPLPPRDVTATAAMGPGPRFPSILAETRAGQRSLARTVAVRSVSSLTPKALANKT